MRIMLDVVIPGKRRRGRSNLGWRHVCKRDVTEKGLKEDNTTNRAAWRKKTFIPATPRWRDKPGTKKKKISVSSYLFNEASLAQSFPPELFLDHLRIRCVRVRYFFLRKVTVNIQCALC